MPLSKRTTIDLREIMSRWVLQDIADAFDGEDIKPSEDYEPNLSGQRRNRAAKYLNSVDINNPDDVAKLIRVIEYVLSEQANRGEDSSRFIETLRRDGYEFRNKKLIHAGEASPVVEARTPPRVQAPEPSTPVADESRSPTAFVSYSWDDESHKQWVLEFATKLRSEGVDAKLDRWEIELGQYIPHFMETAVSTNDFVLIVLTPNYRKKSDERTGGVGYEGHIMTAETYFGADPRKFIPVLREGSWEDSSPRWLRGKRGVDLTSGNPDADEQFRDLAATLHGLQKKAPPLGPSPRGQTLETVLAKVPPVQHQQIESGPIKILNIIISEIGTPRNDGTAGSALYSVPFQLSRVPSSEWAKHFLGTWDRPPRMTTMHRPGIARITRDRLILDGTTVEEVASVHRETLKLVLEKVNLDVEAAEEQRRRRETRALEERRRQKEAAEEAARKISFD